MKFEILNKLSAITLVAFTVQTTALPLTAHAVGMGAIAGAGMAADSIGKLGEGDKSTADGKTTESADSCANQSNDPQAKSYCNMKKIATVAAVSQGVSMAAFTIAGILGVKACSIQTTSQQADVAALQTVTSLDKAAGVVVTNASATRTAADAVDAAIKALEPTRTAVTTAHTNLISSVEALKTSMEAYRAPTFDANAECFGVLEPAWKAEIDVTYESLEELVTKQMKLDGDLMDQSLENDQLASTKALESIGVATAEIEADVKTEVPAAQAALPGMQSLKGQIGKGIALQKAANNSAAPSDVAEAAAVNHAHMISETYYVQAHTLLNTMTTTWDSLLSTLQAHSTIRVNGNATLEAAAKAYVAGIKAFQAKVAAVASTNCASNAASLGGNSKCCTATTTGASNVPITLGPPAKALTGPMKGYDTALASHSKAIDAVVTKASQVRAPATTSPMTTWEHSFLALGTGQPLSPLSTYIQAATNAQTLRSQREGARSLFRGSEYAAFGADVAGGGAVIAATAALKEKVNAQIITQAALPVGMDVAQKLLVDTQYDSPESKQEKLDCSGISSCYALDFLQAAARGLNMAISIKTIIDSDKYGKELKSDNDTVKAAVAGVKPGGAPGSGGGGSGSTDTPSDSQAEMKMLADVPKEEKAKLSPKAIAASMATSKDKAMLPKALETVTGMNAENVAERLMNGESPMMVGMAAVDGNSAEAANLMAMHQNKDKLLEVAKEEIAATSPKGQDTQFETAGPRGRKIASKSDDGLDMNAIMAAFMPKQPQQGPPGAKAVNLTPRAAAPSANSEGFHSADRSLFDVVGTRYQLLQKRFLAGEKVGNDKPAPSGPTTLPKNLYLRK